MHIFSAFKSEFSKFSEVQVEKQHVPVSLHMFRSCANTQNIHKDNENSYFSVEEIEYTSHNTSGLEIMIIMASMVGGGDTGHTDISPARTKFLNKYKEIGSPAYTFDRIFRYRDILSKNDSVPKKRKTKL